MSDSTPPRDSRRSATRRTPYEQGRDACAYGLPMIFCPYGLPGIFCPADDRSSNSMKAQKWLRGWNDHRDEFGFIPKDAGIEDDGDEDGEDD